tara:strand:+ start:3515 stop:4543 length:1029 start_codon:yes stop_codon:yes gene_type:complete
MPRSRAAADFYNIASNNFDIVSNFSPSTVKINNNFNSGVCCDQPTDINLDELKDFMEERINDIQSTLIASNAPIEMIETLYFDVIKPYNDEGPCSLPGIQKLTDLYNTFNEIIECTEDCKDTRLLVYRDILQLLPDIKHTYVEKIIAENQATELKEKNKTLKAQVENLVHQLHICSGTGDSSILGGKLAFTLIKPKPLIYVQALFNITLAWYYYLHGDVVKPKEYQATVEYVESLGTKQEAYDKLIVILDEKYKDEQEELNKLLQGNSTNSDTSSANTPNDTSGAENSNTSSSDTNNSSNDNNSANYNGDVSDYNIDIDDICSDDTDDYSSEESDCEYNNEN